MNLKDGLAGRFSRLSGAQKSWIGLAVLLAGAALLLLFIHLLRMRLFEENPRFTLREIVISPPEGYVSTYWNAVRNRKMREAELAEELSLRPEKTNIFSLNMKALRKKLLAAHPEIEHLVIRKRIPDQLVFQIRERFPVADIGSAPKSVDPRQIPRYLDETGHVFSAEYSLCLNPPRIIDLAGRKELQNLRPGDTVNSDDIRLALDFLRLVRSGYPALIIRKIAFAAMDNSIHCTIGYQGHDFTVILPISMSREKLRNDIPGRLIPALKQQFRKKDFSSLIDLCYEGQAVIRPTSGTRH